MSKKLSFLTAFILLLALGLASESVATDYYVAQNDPAADDANPGTEVLPWETLKKACNTLVAGDTVYVKAGTYIDPTNSFRVINNGTAGNPITFISSPQLAAVVRSPSLPGSRATYAWSLGPNSQYVIVDGFKIEGGIVAAYDRATYCTLRNLELIYGWCASDPTLNWGITLYWSDYCVVENCYVHDLDSSGSSSRNTAGIMLFGDPDPNPPHDICEYNIFQGNTVDAGFNVRNAFGIKAGSLNNNIWRYNVAKNASVGYHTMGSTSGVYNSSNNHYYQNIAIGCGAAFDAGYAVDHSYIYNNTAVDCDSFYTSYYDSVTDIELWNNILQGNNDIVIEWPGYPGIYPFTHLIAFSNYNCFYDFSEFAYREKLPSLHYYTLGDWQSATGYDMDTITSNPLLVGGGDYHLQGGSPCINAGVDLQDYDDDQNTTESINMGAYITGSEIIGHNWGPTPPGQATSPSPADSATDVSVDADLSWTAGTGSTSSDVYFGTDSTPDAGEFQGNQTATTYEPGTMVNNTTYYWRIDEVNAEGTTTGNVWSFTTEGAPQPPGQASNPSPADSATSVSTSADLSWTAGSGATSRDVYFGTSSPGTFQGNQTATTYDPGTMANDTTYYWRIDEINAVGTTSGSVWSFTTETAPAGVYYVDQGNPAADDANPGTEALPWETLKKATLTVQAGDTVYVKAGVYIDTVNSFERKFKPTNTGTAGNPITFISTPQHAAIVRSDSLPSSRQNFAWGISWSIDYIIIDGFKIEGGLVLGYGGGDHCIVRNCELIYGRCPDSDPSLNWGIATHDADYCTIENNYVHSMTDSGNNAHNTACIMVFGNSDYNILQGNTADASN
ncbi:MAG: right-handed parallel beta-helix repeat-containing protein, partial [Planctomycetota bacterium]